MAGPEPIGPADLLAWQQLHDVSLSPWEIDSLLALDRVAMTAAAAARATPAAETPKDNE